MSILLSKLLPMLVYPFGLFISLTFAAGLLVLAKKRKAAIGVFSFGMIVLLVASLPTVAGRLYGHLEAQHPPLPMQEIPAVDAIVILGGAVATPQPPRQSVELTGASDRVLHAVRLYKAGKAPLIVVSGGNVFEQSKVKGEAVYIAELIAEWGVPESAIQFEASSRNTYENAIATRTMLRDRNLKKVLLVTSASHMPRALATFQKAEVDAAPATTDIIVAYNDAPSIFRWLPSAGALNLTTLAIHEYVGILYYRWRDWI